MDQFSAREPGLKTPEWVHDPGPYKSVEAAFEQAAHVVADRHGRDLELLGDFVLPPPDGEPSRDFQTLHVDFGVPLMPGGQVDIALYTALHVPAGGEGSGAATCLVPLDRFFDRRTWPTPPELRRRFARYGASHGRRAGAAAYVEGSLARIVEAGDGAAAELPSVSDEPDFLCGTEFASRAAEEEFFSARGLPLDGIVDEIVLEPGHLLVFANLALAHGRRGSRQPGELRQWVFGRRGAGLPGQEEALEELLAAF